MDLFIVEVSEVSTKKVLIKAKDLSEAQAKVFELAEKNQIHFTEIEHSVYFPKEISPEQWELLQKEGFQVLEWKETKSST